jgi:hypothetical protein
MPDGNPAAMERVARIEQRVDDLDKRVGNVGDVAVAVGVLTERVRGVDVKLQDIVVQLSDEVDSRDQRETDTRKERRDIKIALWTITVMIVCALIGAATIILTSAH